MDEVIMGSPENEFWRSIINQLDDTEEKSEFGDLLLEDERGHLYRFASEVYIFQSSLTPRSFSLYSGQRFYDLGEMTMDDAKDKVKKRRK